jgi:formate dehydrogenase iron-sulfur subunit
MRARLPKDAAALALGADKVADALVKAAAKRGIALELIRTGSHGMVWLEPMLELETDKGWRAFGPLAPGDVDAVLDGTSPKALGDIAEYPWLKRQTRLIFNRCGMIDPVVPPAFVGLKRAHEIGPAAVLEEVTRSGLRGRGGAGFPAGIKWKGCADAQAPQKYIVCNADEGDSGTYADRMLMEGDPFLLLEGMAIAGFATGATKGYIYIRSEYPHAIVAMQKAAAQFAEMDIEIRVGAGSYVCGEETALLESLEGKRGQVRAKPPLPVHQGLFGAPTVINNVLTFASVPAILEHGAVFYANFGMGRSRGTMPVQLAGDIKHGGLFETAFGLTLNELIYDIGGGTRSGRPVRAVQVGGPLGAYFPPALFDTKFDYEAFAARDGLLGHGGVVVFNDSVDMLAQARFAMEFCAIESCGKCTPCRIGAVRGQETIDKILRGQNAPDNLALLRDLCDTMKSGSLCALGGFVPYPVLSALNHFPQDFVR